jgi:hypothetical protein
MPREKIDVFPGRVRYLDSTEFRTSTEAELRTAEHRGELESEVSEARFEDDLTKHKNKYLSIVLQLSEFRLRKFSYLLEGLSRSVQQILAAVLYMHNIVFEIRAQKFRKSQFVKKLNNVKYF